MQQNPSKNKYIPQEKCLEKIGLKFYENEFNEIYLINPNETFKQKINSKSFTNIKKGIDKLIQNKQLSFNSKEDKRNYSKAIYCLKHKKCSYCGNGFKPKSNSEKYCSNHCRKQAKLEQDEKNKRKQRQKPHHYEKSIGTTNIGSHANKNQNYERNTIRKEHKRIFGNKKYYT